MIERLDLCPICGWSKGTQSAPIKEPTFDYTCPRCGRFKITYEAICNLRSVDERKRALLSAILRERFLLDLAPVTLTTENIEDLSSGVIPSSVPEKVDRFLLNFSRIKASPGQFIELDWDKDYPLAYCQNKGELYFFRDILQKEGLIEKRGQEINLWRLTLPGWVRVGELQRTAIDSHRVFVAMSFKPEWDNAWKQGIRPAIEEDCGYQAIHMLEIVHTEDINYRIIAEIRKSKFMVADFSDNPGGVYLEAGFELGLGRQVIWTCIDEEDRKKALHFDISHYNFIFWKDPQDLRVHLRDCILALFGEGDRSESRRPPP
jgi:hypothetical protein